MLSPLICTVSGKLFSALIGTILTILEKNMLMGKNSILNQEFIKCFASTLFSTTLFLCFLLLLSEDIHPNPGTKFLTTMRRSDTSLMTSQHLIHLNIQSLLPKIDLLETEMQAYDIVILKESWLNQQIRNDGISIPNFNPPHRKNRVWRTEGGVAVYTKFGISLVDWSDLLCGDIET